MNFGVKICKIRFQTFKSEIKTKSLVGTFNFYVERSERKQNRRLAIIGTDENDRLSFFRLRFFARVLTPKAGTEKNAL
jgi:hypothetical protein